MKLEAEVKFECPKFAERLELMQYTSGFSADAYGNGGAESFEINDIENQAYALRIVNEEFKEAVKRINNRLLAEGFGKESFRKPLMGLDADGNIVDVNR